MCIIELLLQKGSVFLHTLLPGPFSSQRSPGSIIHCTFMIAITAPGTPGSETLSLPHRPARTSSPRSSLAGQPYFLWWPRKTLFVRALPLRIRIMHSHCRVPSQRIRIAAFLQNAFALLRSPKTHCRVFQKRIHCTSG